VLRLLAARRSRRRRRLAGQQGLQRGKAILQLLDLGVLLLCLVWLHLNVGRDTANRAKLPAPVHTDGQVGIACITPLAYSSKIAWSPDGTTLALISSFNGLSLWNASSGSLISRPGSAAGLAAEAGLGVGMSWSPDSKVLRLATRHGLFFLGPDGRPSPPVLGSIVYRPEDLVRCIAVSPDGERRATSFEDGRIDLWRGGSLAARFGNRFV
jgi:WD40 repeat protein